MASTNTNQSNRGGSNVQLHSGGLQESLVIVFTARRRRRRELHRPGSTGCTQVNWASSTKRFSSTLISSKTKHNFFHYSKIQACSYVFLGLKHLKFNEESTFWHNKHVNKDQLVYFVSVYFRKQRRQPVVLPTRSCRSVFQRKFFKMRGELQFRRQLCKI